MEIILSIVLFAVVILGVGAFDIYLHQMFGAVERRMKVLNEISFILEHIKKYLVISNGDLNNPSLLKNVNNLLLRIDRNFPPTPSIYNDDVWVAYIFSDNNLSFCDRFDLLNNSCIGNRHLLSSSVVEFDFTVSYNLVQINNFTLRYFPQLAYRYLDNPQITFSNLTLISLPSSTN